MNNSDENNETHNVNMRNNLGYMQNGMNNNYMPEVLTNQIYTPAFLRTQIGRLMRVEFLIGTNNLVDRIGILSEVGASYIVLRSFENDSLVYCDLYSIKFITISTTSSLVPSINNGYIQSGNNGYFNNYRNDYTDGRTISNSPIFP